jgi:hypothetical protein
LDSLMQSSTLKHLLVAAESGDAAAQFKRCFGLLEASGWNPLPPPPDTAVRYRRGNSRPF